MKKIKLVVIPLLVLLIPMLLYSCLYEFSDRRIYPEDGIWYCDELQLYIHFGRNKTSTAIINGEEIDCDALYMDDSLSITVERKYNESTSENRVIFPGEFVSLKENKLVLCHRDTKKEYVFVRIQDTKTGDGSLS